MTPDIAICARCRLPDCDTTATGCRLRQTRARVTSMKRAGLPVEERSEAAAAMFVKERWIDWAADQSEARR